MNSKLVLGKANLDEFSATLIEEAGKNKNIVAVTSDSRGSGKLTNFAEQLPQQIIEVGIAEQNLVGVSAGLASAGKKPFAVSPSCFLSARSLEQIKNDVAYSDQPVVLVGISAGVSYGALGSTHHSLHDIAVLRTINNLTILIPADNFETHHAIQEATKAKHPVFIKFGKKPMPVLPRLENKFEIGKASVIREGGDIAFIACGETVAIAFEAAQLLQKKNIHARVISMHTIKPIDKKAIYHAGKTCKAVITIEEHSIYGGLGEACAAIMMQENLNVPLKIMGLPDEETISGTQEEILQHYGISAQGLFDEAIKLLKT